jgi:excisionase family DNA binding protein
MTKKQQDHIDGHFFNVRKASEFLDVNPNTIRKWAQQGKLHGVKIGTRGDWRFTKEDLLKMIKSTTNQKIYD